MLNRPLILAFALSPMAAHANEFHYENFPVGDHPSALAGAYTSISGATYSMHYNPAGIAGIGKQLSGTLNAFGHSSTTFNEVFPKVSSVETTEFGRENIYSYDSLDRTSSTAIPGFLGYTTEFGDFTLGGYLASPDISYEELADDDIYEFDGDINIYSIDSPLTDVDGFATENGFIKESRNLSLDSEYKTTQVGVSMAYSFSEHLDMGLTLGAIIKKKKEIYTIATNYLEQSQNTDYFYYGSLQEATRIVDEEMMLYPKLGVLWQDKGYSIGLTLAQKQAASRTLKYDYQTISAEIETSSDHMITASDDQFNNADLRFESSSKQAYPLEISLGTSIIFSSGNKMSFDIHHYTAVEDEVEFAKVETGDDSDPFTYIDTTRQFKAVTNLALAFDSKINENNKIIFGLFSDLSNTELNLYDNSANYTQYLAHEDIDLYGFSLSVNHKNEEFNLTTGIVAAFGSGQAASYELLAFGGGHNGAVEDFYEIERKNFNVFFGIQY